jgi:DNA helicase IV
MLRGIVSESVITNESRIREKAAEQEYFDQALAARDEAETAMSPVNWSAGTAAERRAFQKAAQRRAMYSPDEPVAFGRMDMEDGETYYVGKAAVHDPERNLLVINWQMPIAAGYNQATAADPCGLSRKRAFDAPKSRIRSFDDLVFRELAARVAELDGPVGMDDALLRSMSEKRSGTMRDIVSTIQAAQDKIVREDREQLLIVQGGPGTGKTAVALHRVSWLLFTYRDDIEPKDILIVGPNPTFTSYIRRVLPDLGDHDVAQASLPELLAPGVDVAATEAAEVAIVKGKASMADVLAEALNDRIREPADTVRVQQRNSGSFFILPVHQVVEKIRELRSDIYLVGRAKLRRALLDMCLASAIFSRASAEDLVDPKSLESALERLWPQLSPQQFLRELLGSRERLLRAAGAALTGAEIQLLYRPSADRVGDEPWTLADLALLDEASELLKGEPDLFQHIVIDEAQDLSEMQLGCIRRRSQNGSITVVGDIAQSTGPYATDSWERAREMLASKLPAIQRDLEHGYRVPREVFELAGPVLAVAAPGVSQPRIVRDVEVGPRLIDIDADSLCGRLEELVSEHSGKGRFVGVIAPEPYFEAIRKVFKSEDVQWSEASNGDLNSSINLVTPAESKGLEFDAVIVLDPQRIVELEHGFRLLYIALTRTTKWLDILYPTGTLPEVLGGITPADPGGVDGDSAEENIETGSAEEELPESVPVVERDRAPNESAVSGSNSSVEERGAVQLSSTERRLVEMNARIYADEILASVHPKLVAAVVDEVARMVADSLRMQNAPAGI